MVVDHAPRTAPALSCVGDTGDEQTPPMAANIEVFLRARWLAIGAAVLAVPLAVLGAGLAETWWFAAITVPSALVTLHLSRSLPARLQPYAMAATVLIATTVVLIYALGDVRRVFDNIAYPPQWDLQWFWIQGRVAAEGLNFYDPARAHELATTMFGADANFLAELYFWYPPPTMLLFLPLGFFDIHEAVGLWYGAQAATIFACIVLMQRLFFRQSSWLGGLMAAALLLSARPTSWTIVYGQTNFIVLLMLLLVWLDRDRARAGAWVAIGVFVKPIVAAVGLFLLLRGRWSAIKVAIGGAVAILMASVIVFGPATVLGYFTDAPTTQAPNYLYYQDVNQSLLATLLRLTQDDASSGWPLLNPLFVNVVVVFAIVTAWLLLRKDAVSDRHALALCIPFGLIAYPGTLDHYLVALMIPIGYLWMERERFSVGFIAVAVLTSVTLAITAIQSGVYSFLASVLLWVVLAGAGLVAIARTTWRGGTRRELVAIEAGDERRRALPLP
jgi:glycosyl transferase family 87